ncbi:cytochrome [Streptomyces sp. 6N223]|uniref:cytochrome n=1 Tax=Streptomyces sp. 6N223 TaxID=3457412 RepID=UPI003FD6B294
MSTPLEELPAEPLLTREYETGRRAEIHDRLRTRYGAVAPVDLMGQSVWLVLDYPEALAVLTDESLWKKSLAHWRAYTEGRVPKDWPLLPALECDMVIFFDDQRRMAARAALEAAIEPFQDLSNPIAQRLRDLTVRYADELLGFLAGGGGGLGGMAELCGQYARPLPLMVANHMLGFPVAQGEEVIMDVWRVLDAGPDGPEAIERLMAGLRELVAQKRARPGEDVPSYLLAHDPDISDEELAWELYLVLATTADETGSLLANTLVEALSEDMARHSTMQVGFYGEIINHAAIANPPMHNMTFRFPVVPTELGRFGIAAGDPVMVSPAAAHTCPHFAGGVGGGAGAQQGALLTSRAHLSFGAGPHRCPAQDLAFMIVGIGIERLFAHFEKVELAMPADQLPWRSSPLFSGLRALPVRYLLTEGRARTTALAVVEEEHASAGERPLTERPERPSPFWRLMATLRRRARHGRG